ncbi:MAG TPA: hypothetical protein VK168_04535 [Saprospiraceae bacterium]|nr:hypothetical protein [Saprospiraceae bacterium]
MMVSAPKISLFVGLFLLNTIGLWAQVDTSSTAQEEDYSIYDQVEFADEKARRYCSPKIFNLSPQRFISLQYDGQLAHEMRVSPIGSYAEEAEVPVAESATATFVGGLRFSANIPVISRNSVVWQMGANYWQTGYQVKDLKSEAGSANLIRELDQTGLRTMGLNTTLFKPLGEYSFLLFQGSADLSGNYTFSNMQSLRYLRYSAAAIWGRRPNDRKQWGVGLARTYRVGEMNYIPVVMFNYTSPNRKWGTEILFPARAHYRRTFNPRNLMLVGYELEGQSYRMDFLSDTERSLEIRRGEMRARVEFQRQLTGFIWLSAQVGWRYNWSFNADTLPDDGKEFFRGFTGSQPYAMLNTLGNPLYFNIGVHLVSP